MRTVLRRASTRISFLANQSNVFDSDSDLKSDMVLISNAIDIYNRGNLSKALVCFESIKESLASKTQSQKLVDEINNHLSDIYLKLGQENVRNKNFIIALSMFEKLKSLKENKSDQKQLNEALDHISEAYKLLYFENKQKGKYLEALNYAQKQKEICKNLGKSVNEVNLELSELYTFMANQYLSKGKVKFALEVYEKLKEILIEKNQSQALLDLYSVMGELHFEISEIKQAVQHFTKLRDLAELKKDYIRKMYSYEHIGICYQIVRDYRSALINFKMLLQLAWKLNNIEMELVAYDYMSIQYFYLGDLDGASYYHNRIWKGVTEKFTSPTREISNKALEALKIREKNPVISSYHRPITRIDAFNMEAPEATIGLPSPRSSSGQTDMQLLPSEAKKNPRKKPEHKASRSKVGQVRCRTSFKHSNSKSLNSTFEIKKYSDSSKKIKPFILLSHLSPMESVKNFLYAEQIK